jgi:hypothetical protein
LYSLVLACDANVAAPETILAGYPVFAIHRPLG